MMDSFQIRKQIRSQKIEEISFTPTSPGQYRFYCPVNGMEGTLLVKELTSALPSEESMGSRPVLEETENEKGTK
jgi:plastocyanin domain-containing protein